MKLFNAGYKEHLKSIRREYYHKNHYCCSCGIYSKQKLTAGHPVKDGRVCETCRIELWVTL